MPPSRLGNRFRLHEEEEGPSEKGEGGLLRSICTFTTENTINVTYKVVGST